MTAMARKITVIILCAMLVLGAALLLTGCGDADYSVPETELFTAEKMKQTLEDFLGDGERADRTSMTTATVTDDGEKLAADWLAERLTGLLGEGSVSVNDFAYTTEYGDRFESQNVVGELRGDPEKTDRRRIVIGANYDNTYATVNVSQYNNYVYFNGTGAEAAMDNGTGVAVVLALAEYFARESVRETLAVDIDFVFYGMGNIEHRGAYAYIQNLGETARSKLMLAINVDRLGGDKLLTYFDEESTAHGRFILETAEEAGFGDYVSEPNAFTADYGMRSANIEDLPYTPKALVSDAAAYFDNYSICAITSGADNPFWLSDRERSSDYNISGTSSDTMENLERLSPDYASQMAVAAELIAGSVTRDGFVDALVAGRDSGRGYMWMVYPIAGYIAVAVLSLAALVPIVVLVRRYEKNHRDDPPGVKKNVRVAVFGMDYEKPKDDEVFVDFASADPFADFDSPDPDPGKDKDGGGVDNGDNGGSGGGEDDGKDGK